MNGFDCVYDVEWDRRDSGYWSAKCPLCDYRIDGAVYAAGEAALLWHMNSTHWERLACDRGRLIGRA